MSCMRASAVPERRLRLLVCVPAGPAGQKKVEALAIAELDKLRPWGYNDCRRADVLAALSCSAVAAGKVPVTHVLFCKTPIAADASREINNGLIGLNRDVFFRLVQVGLGAEGVRNLFGIGQETYHWLAHRTIRRALRRRIDPAWEQRLAPVYRQCLVEQPDGSSAVFMERVDAGTGRAILHWVLGDSDWQIRSFLDACRAVGAHCVAYTSCGDCCSWSCHPALLRCACGLKPFLELPFSPSLSRHKNSDCRFFARCLAIKE